jgi:hypothetical protein
VQVSHAIVFASDQAPTNVFGARLAQYLDPDGLGFPWGTIGEAVSATVVHSPIAVPTAELHLHP